LAIKRLTAAHREGTADIGNAFGTAQEGLGLSRDDSTKEVGFNADARRSTEAAGQTFGLVELAFAQSRWMKRHGHNKVPLCRGQSGHGAAQQQIGKKRLEAKGAIVFVTMDDIQNAITSDNRGTGGRKIQSEFAAIGAFKDSGNLPLIRRAAAFAEGRIDKTGLRTAAIADESLPGSGPGLTAKLADFRITEREGGIDPLFA